jgi:hypothetical protein
MKYLLSLLLLACTAAPAAEIAGLVRKHTAHSRFEKRPFGNDDFSYGAYLEFFEGPAGWRLGAAYAPDLDSSRGFESAITPEISLLLQDGLWETGVSVLKDYLDDGSSTGWGSTYYQLILGLNLPVGKSLSVGVHSFYPLDSFSNLSDFRFSNLDYGLLVRLKF